MRRFILLAFVVVAVTFVPVACTTGEDVSEEGAPVDAGQGQEPMDAEESGAPNPPTPQAEALDALTVARSELGPDAVIATSGLVYEDTVIGEGREVQTCDFVGVNYTGRTAAGTPFEGSAQRGRPVRFSPGYPPPQAVPGLDLGVIGMKMGGRRTIVMPADGPSLGTPMNVARTATS